MIDTEFSTVFQQLKALLEPYSAYMRVLNTPEQFYLESYKPGPNKKPMFFGSVQVRKNYVSYYLMPVYVYPELQEQISPALKKRMQGKSCFNFRHPDPELFEELKTLTQQGFEKYKQDGWVDQQPPAEAI